MRRMGHAALALVAALTLIPGSVEAQWGIKGGVARSNVKATAGFGDRTAISAGISNNMGSGVATFMSEALFVQKGVESTGAGARTTFTANNLEVTGLLRLNIGNGPVRPILFGGGYYSYLISEEYKEFDASGREVASVTAYSDGSTTDYGWVAGAGIVMSRFTIDARYAVGLKHSVYTGDLSNLDDYESLTVMVGVAF